MTRIFIEDNELDLSQGLTNQITYSIDDLKLLDTKATSFSKTIILPGTARNNNLLGNIFEFNNSNFTDGALKNVEYNFNASRQASARIEVNGLQIMKGVLRLLEIIIDGKSVEYECAVFGELGGFIAKVGNGRLEDLNFADYDHELTAANITGSWDSWNDGEGYYYPLIDYGGVSTGAFGVAKKDYQFQAFRPALFLREYMDKIITGAGYTWSSDFFDTDFFKRIIIPNNQKALFIPKSQIFYSTSAPNYALDGVLTDQSVTVTDGVTIASFVGGLFTTSDNKDFTYTGGNTTLNIKGIFKGNYDLVGAGANNNRFTISVRIEVFKNSNLAYTNGQTYGRTGRGNGQYNTTLNCTIPIATSDILTFQITTIVTKGVGGFVTAVDYYSDVTGTSVTIDSEVPVLSPAEIGDDIKFNEILPKNIFQRDFFASILKMFYLLVTEDKEKSKHLVIEPWVNFFDTTPTSYIDWSNKVDRGSPIRIKPMSEVNARYYELKFKGDSDYYNEDYKKKYNEGYGDRVFDNVLDFASDTQKVEVIFASTPLVGYDGEDKITPAIFKKNNALEERIEHTIRIMQAKKITGVASWDIMSGATVLSSVTNYGYAGHLDDPDAPNADINFGVPRQLYFELAAGNLSNNLFNAYYSPYFAEITDKDSRVLIAKVKLTETDIYNLDFSKFIYIDGGIYRVSKITDFVPGSNDTTQVELLRVIYTTY